MALNLHKRVKVLAQNKHVQLGLEIWILLKLHSDDFCFHVNCSNIQKTMYMPLKIVELSKVLQCL